MAAQADKTVKAAVLIIGNEILSGRTQDTNTKHIAAKLNDIGVRLSEVRVVPDVKEKIVEALNALRAECDYVFTTGGIGPTHDDITAESVAAAFGVALEDNDAAMQMLRAHYDPRGEEVTPARAKMAKIPAGASLIPNPVSGAPGFTLENVHVLAGVPKIMEAMLDHIIGGLEGGAVVHSISVEAGMPESVLAGPLGELQTQHPDIDIGSYPSINQGRWSATIVMRTPDEELLAQAERDLHDALDALRKNPVIASD